MDRLEPFKRQLHALWDAVRRRPVARWGAVSQVTPLLIVLDGETTAISPVSCVKTVTVGQRVYCMEVERQVVVVAAVEP